MDRIKNIYTWFAQSHRRTSRGVTMIFVLVFGLALALVVSGLVSLSMYQLHTFEKKIMREKGLYIAEAGLNYYKWFLAHFPTDVKNGTGVAGPYVVPFTDTSGSAIGSYELTITGNFQCNELTSVDIKSKGYLTGHSDLSRTVSARSSLPSSAEYSFIFNGAASFGAASNSTGAIHANSGIRMDGTHNSLVQSAVATWSCTSSYGCSPTTTKPGVFGSGGTPSLWRYPSTYTVPSINFATMVDMAAMKTRAQTYGLYFANYSVGVRNKGYHVIFRNDGRIDVYRVTATTGTASGANTDYHTISAETFLGTYSIPASCAVVYFEDNLWVEGVVKGKITLVSNDSVNSGFAPDIVIINNITRLATAGADGLTMIAERNILLSATSPDFLTVEGVLVAVTGTVGRNCYAASVPTALRNTFTRVGSVVAAVSTGFACGSPVTSGYQTRIAAYDRALVFSPPPFTPSTSTKTRLIRWREEEQ